METVVKRVPKIIAICIIILRESAMLELGAPLIHSDVILKKRILAVEYANSTMVRVMPSRYTNESVSPEPIINGYVKIVCE